MGADRAILHTDLLDKGPVTYPFGVDYLCNVLFLPEGNRANTWRTLGQPFSRARPSGMLGGRPGATYAMHGCMPSLQNASAFLPAPSGALERQQYPTSKRRGGLAP